MLIDVNIARPLRLENVLNSYFTSLILKRVSSEMLSTCRTSSWFKPRRAMDVSEEPDWDPDEVSILQEEWNPRALVLLKDQPDYAKYRSERVFRFVHLFSGPRDVLKEALET